MPTINMLGYAAMSMAVAKTANDIKLHVSVESVLPRLDFDWSAILDNHYYLYTPEETIRRARSRIGEKKYNLFLNNCEHFAIWCKTGIHESHQVDAILKKIMTEDEIIENR